MSTAKEDYLKEEARVKEERERLDDLYPMFRERRKPKPTDTWTLAGYLSNQGELLCPSCGLPIPLFETKYLRSNGYVCGQCERAGF